jgi:FlaA1/EpsC-like NDP-sugar epimerase
MEDNGIEAIKNNVIGTRNVAQAALKNKVKKFVLVSTDKAVNPTNIMGATKRAAEMIVHILGEGQSDTVFSAVRFGNVLNSNGSVVPIFERQIQQGGPLRVTHKDITRYFMTIPEAVSLIIRAGTIGKNQDLFVLDMGEPVKIYDLAKWLIAIRGYVAEKDIKIDVTGLRPGEKLYEELLVEQESVDKTTEEGIFKTKNYNEFNTKAFEEGLARLEQLVGEGDVASKTTRDELKGMISTYKPASH